ncbi:MAG: class I SAM-dependent methyltransferase family protein [Methanotrichaceae archaeon]|nr:class I SAM-dependent methyltransferase family protein [Methanotrichaceae archaeon]
MPDQSLGIKVERKKVESIRRALVEMNIFDRSRKIMANESHVWLPILTLDEKSLIQLQNIADFALAAASFLPEERQPRIEEILGFKPSFEVVGDIAIVDQEKAEEVASALMRLHKNIKAVISPISEVEGEFRTRRFRHIAGEPRTITTHKEHGLSYYMDLERAYFSPRLGTERLRVAKQVLPSDFILDMFAGVGPFALLMAKKGARVVAIDKNPAAINYLRKNAILNKINIDILEGDSAELALLYENQADHVIMNLPHSAAQFLFSAIRATKSNGIVHYYSFAPESDLYRDAELIRKAAKQLGVTVEIIYEGVVRSYSPRCYNIIIDFRVSKTLPSQNAS